MLRQLPIAVALALLAAGSAAAQTAPSFRGYTGLVIVPTADVVAEREYNFGVMTEETDDFEANDVFANYSPTSDLEIGINSFRGVGSRDREAVINAKYRFLPETQDRAAVALGLTDLTGEVKSTAYVVASMSVARGVSLFGSRITNIRGHLGVGGGRLDGLFGGLSLFVGNRVMFSAEWDSEDTHLGLKFMPVRGWRLHAAWIDVGDSADLGLGLSFSSSY